MPKLITNIIGIVTPEISGFATYVSNVKGDLQREDYINIHGFIAYTQNLSQIEDTRAITPPIVFGPINTNNLQLITLEIDF